MRGYVTRFAPYHQADDIDAAAWFSIVQGALRLFPCHDWAQRHAALRIGTPDALVQLRFPFGPDQDMSKPIAGDLRAGTARLLNGNSWCRPYEGMFRLHGPDPEKPGTTLRWTGVHAPGAFHLGATLRCPCGTPSRSASRFPSPRRTAQRWPRSGSRCIPAGRPTSCWTPPPRRVR